MFKYFNINISNEIIELYTKISSTLKSINMGNIFLVCNFQSKNNINNGNYK
jgi:hypothetical protein